MRRRDRAGILFAIATSAVLVGCPGPSERVRQPDVFDPLPDEEDDLGASGFTEEEQKQSRGKLGGVWVDCYSSFRTRDGAKKDLERLTKSCGPPTSLAPITEARLSDPQSESTAVDRFTFVAAGGGGCYRVFASADGSVEDLDVALLDDDGSLIVSDRARGPATVVPARGPLCLDRAGSYTLEVSVVRGKGAFAVQVWGDR